MICLLTGPAQGGKTRAAAAVVRAARTAGLEVMGVLCPGRMRRGVRTSIAVQDIATAERVSLASRGAGTGEGAGSFRFEAKGLRHGRRALCRAVLRRPAVVVVDEIGPLELSGRGWRRAVDRLVPIYRRYRTRLLVLVVRERLVEAVRREWRLGPCAPPGPQRRRQP